MKKKLSKIFRTTNFACFEDSCYLIDSQFHVIGHFTAYMLYLYESYKHFERAIEVCAKNKVQYKVIEAEDMSDEEQVYLETIIDEPRHLTGNYQK